MTGHVLQLNLSVASLQETIETGYLPDVRIYDLRHGAATVLLAAKVDLKVVSELLGHSWVAITADIYAHVLSENATRSGGEDGRSIGRS